MGAVIRPRATSDPSESRKPHVQRLPSLTEVHRMGMWTDMMKTNGSSNSSETETKDTAVTCSSPVSPTSVRRVRFASMKQESKFTIFEYDDDENDNDDGDGVDDNRMGVVTPDASKQSFTFPNMTKQPSLDPYAQIWRN